MSHSASSARPDARADREAHDQGVFPTTDATNRPATARKDPGRAAAGREGDRLSPRRPATRGSPEAPRPQAPTAQGLIKTLTQGQTSPVYTLEPNSCNVWQVAFEGRDPRRNDWSPRTSIFPRTGGKKRKFHVDVTDSEKGLSYIAAGVPRRSASNRSFEPAPPQSPRRSPRNIHVAAAAAPRLVSAEYPRRGRGGAATFDGISTSRPRRRRDSSRRNIQVAAAAAPRFTRETSTSRPRRRRDSSETYPPTCRYYNKDEIYGDPYTLERCEKRFDFDTVGRPPQCWGPDYDDVNSAGFKKRNKCEGRLDPLRKELGSSTSSTFKRRPERTSFATMRRV